MTHYDLNTLCDEALSVWGREAQEAVAIGEIGELLTLFGKRAQRRDKPEQWIDEIADVTIILRQLAFLHGVDAVEARIQQKLKRLEARLHMPHEAFEQHREQGLI